LDNGDDVQFESPNSPENELRLEDLILNDIEMDHYEENSTKRDASLLHLNNSEENHSFNLHLD
jgi:hypothetical protein